MILPSCLRSCLLFYSCACDIHPLREDEYHSERSTSFLERCTSKQWLRYTSLEMKYSSLKMKYSSLSDIHPLWEYEYHMHRSTNSKYSFTGGSSCDIRHIGPLGQHLVFDSVLSQRTNMANITLRSSCKRVLNIIYSFTGRIRVWHSPYSPLGQHRRRRRGAVPAENMGNVTQGSYL